MHTLQDKHKGHTHTDVAVAHDFKRDMLNMGSVNAGK